MTKTTSFQADLRPLFTERDILGTSKRSTWEVTMTSKSTLGHHLRSHSWNRWRCNAAPATKRRRSLAAISH